MHFKKKIILFTASFGISFLGGFTPVNGSDITSPKNQNSKPIEALPSPHTKPEVAADSIEITNAWARPSMSTNNNNSAIYFELENKYDTDLKLTSAQCDIANKTEIHQSFVDQKGISIMRKIENHVIPGKTKVSFKPGGLHIMLLDLKEILKVNNKIKLDLYFESGIKKTVEAEVKNS